TGSAASGTSAGKVSDHASTCSSSPAETSGVNVTMGNALITSISVAGTEAGMAASLATSSGAGQLALASGNAGVTVAGDTRSCRSASASTPDSGVAQTGLSR